MKSSLLRAILALPAFALVLTACVPAAYRVGDQTYKSREEAWTASARRDAEAEAAISAGIRPLVERKALLVIPTAAALSRTFEARVTKTGKTYAAPGTPARLQDDFMADTAVANWKSLGASLKKANIYQNVTVEDVETTEPNIQPSSTQDVISIYLGADGGSPVVYFQSAKYGKQVVAIDTGKASLGDRRRSFIDDIKTKALQ
jgi:hypothetical protein